MTKEHVLNAPLYYDGRPKMFEVNVNGEYYPFYALGVAEISRLASNNKLTPDPDAIRDILRKGTPTIGIDGFIKMISEATPDQLFNIFMYFVSLQDFETGDVFKEKYDTVH